MITYQDWEQAKNKIKWIAGAISQYMGSEQYKLAVDADEYEAQRNVTVNKTVKLVYDITGVSAPDPTASNNRIASNFFHRLNADRCSYSLGNGISFPVEEGKKDTIKEQLGNTFDTQLNKAAGFALRHGVSFLFVNGDQYPVFPMTQFLPLWDEDDGTLRAGIRFWSLEWGKKPVTAVVYEEDGYTKYRTQKGKNGLGALEEVEGKRAYKETIAYSEADGEEVVGEDNYGVLPIVPVYADENKQSTLVGMRANIDAYDLIHSGFANDLQDCAQIYWLIGNAMGMDEKDVNKLRDRLLFQHMAVVDTDNSSVTPYTQEIPYNARMAALAQIRNSIYENFGGLDVHTIAAGATNDHIDAAYQPVDEEADQFEYQIIQAVQQVLRIKGIEPAVPQFKRNRISNQKEQTEMVLMAADHIDEETLLNKLPFITVDEIKQILERKDAENAARFEEEPKEEIEVEEV
jgi:hypothetical protein